jgi:hypothetical protein
MHRPNEATPPWTTRTNVPLLPYQSMDAFAIVKAYIYPSLGIGETTYHHFIEPRLLPFSERKIEKESSIS